ncbi:MAG: cytochrome c biogenesis protein CcdA [Polyangiales bacterium]
MEHSLAAVFGAGVLSFASPCVLPMVPIYLATLAGGSVTSLTEDPPRGRLIARASAFALGLSVPFVLLGMTASTLGRALSAHRAALSLAGGVLLLVFALRTLGVLRLGFLERDARPALSRVDARGGLGGAFLFGAAFGLGWTPCVGPVLGAVLTWTARSGADPAQGALTLGVYAMGIALPLVIAGAFAPTALRAVRKLARRAVWIERATGLALAATGLWLITQNLPAAAPVPVAVAATAPAPAAPCATEATGCGLPSAGASGGAQRLCSARGSSSSCDVTARPARRWRR